MNAWLLIAAANGLLAVAAGAFGAHALAGALDAPALQTFETGARYHMYHALAMGLAALALRDRRPARLAAALFLAGLVLFSGSLYALALTGLRPLAYATPFGGVAFLAGWAALGYAALGRAKVAMFEQPQDFADESAALHALLAPLPEAALAERTAFKGWSLADIVGHLHFWNRAALLSLAEPEAFRAVGAKVIAHFGAGGTLRDFERAELAGLGGRALLAAWHDFAQAMAARFAAADPSARVAWVGPDMSVRSAITARLMETWAHGQAAYDALGVVRRNADRIRNIAVLGVNTYDWSFKVRGQKPPQPKPHLRLEAPSGATWTWNEPSETDLIEGAAEEFCQVVAQVRNIADTRLVVRGAAAAAWMATAQCFAGPPETPPLPGTRRTGARPAWAGLA